MTCAYCGVTSDTAVIHIHHVVGRVGKDKDKPENLIELCAECHRKWHDKKPMSMAWAIYRYMKWKHDDKFPISVNGVPVSTKWIREIEGWENE